MNTQIQALLDKENVGVLSVLLPDGSPHVSAMHYSYSAEPFRIFVQTALPTNKTWHFERDGDTVKGAFVVGLSENDWVTLQVRGDVSLVRDPARLEEITKIHYAKFPHAEEYRDSGNVFLEIVPNWSRYSDFKTKPKTVIRHIGE
ncbi:MAG: hypothetical protein AB200_00540 [Parcubacteria bacterium C7867-005]|nr:MAG: hypothetical protein AB200_00540 [Parcubacteria bacterium C7867-005]